MWIHIPDESINYALQQLATMHQNISWMGKVTSLSSFHISISNHSTTCFFCSVSNHLLHPTAEQHGGDGRNNAEKYALEPFSFVWWRSHGEEGWMIPLYFSQRYPWKDVKGDPFPCYWRPGGKAEGASKLNEACRKPGCKGQQMWVAWLNWAAGPSLQTSGSRLQGCWLRGQQHLVSVGRELGQVTRRGKGWDAYKPNFSPWVGSLVL